MSHDLGPDDFTAAWNAAAALTAEQEAGTVSRETTEAPSEPAKEPAETEAHDTEPAPKSDETADTADGDGEQDANAEPSEERRDQELARLKALAEKHGFKIEGETVTVDERAQFRAERRKSKEALRAEREAFEAEMQAARSKVTAETESCGKFKAALEALDVDALAQLVGHKNWNELNQHVFRQKSSPEAKRLDAVQRELQAEREQRAKEKQEQESRAQAAKVEREIREYKAAIQSDLNDSEDETVRALGGVQGLDFHELVLRHERAEYDGQTTIERKESIARALADARKTWEQLNPIFSGKNQNSAAKQVEAAVARKGADGKPVKPAAVKAKAPPSLDQIDTSTPEGEKLWYELAARQMNDAQQRA